MTTPVVPGLLLLVLLLVMIVGGPISTHKEVQQYFRLPAHVGSVPENVRSAVLTSVKIGSSREEVDTFLRRRGIGKDGNSGCDPSQDKGQLVCSVGTRSHVWNLVSEECRITFLFDSNKRLDNGKRVVNTVWYWA